MMQASRKKGSFPSNEANLDRMKEITGAGSLFLVPEAQVSVNSTSAGTVFKKSL